MALKLGPTGLGSGIDKDRRGLHHLQRRVGHGAHPRTARRAYSTAIS